jgi:hypothetical protein
MTPHALNVTLAAAMCGVAAWLFLRWLRNSAATLDRHIAEALATISEDDVPLPTSREWHRCRHLQPGRPAPYVLGDYQLCPGCYLFTLRAQTDINEMFRKYGEITS